MNTIGRYQLVEKLGQGGMGIVYRAFDPLLQRVVAVKLIAAIESNDELRERFFREARAAGQLSHKNIITIHDLGEHEGQPFLAMEFLEGQDLQQRMASHAPMTLARKLELAIEMCEGIEYAHVHGVIHRDIKPANIFITTTGVTKILDFGLARIITSELTNSNMMMGTLNYMAPEQVRGERADHRSDIFSTGVVLYELLGGKKAFDGDSFGATLYKILQEVPEPLPQIDAHIPPELVAVVERALEKTRETRYQHMSEMVRDLTDYRQRMMLINSPAFGTLAHDAATMAAPATPIPSERPPSAGPQTSGRTMPGATVAAAPVPVPAGASPDAASPVARRRSRILAASLACVVLIAALVTWSMWDGSPAAPPPAGATAAPPADPTQQPDIASRLELASKALQAGDDAAAQRHADAVLAISPNHAEARRLRDSARQTASTSTKSLANARSLLAAGRFDEASRAAGEVLAVDPENVEAKRLMDEGAARSRGKGVEDARGRTARARNAAAGAGASTLASGPYAAAVAAERDATNLYKRGQLAEAMARFWEATGLFRSAEIAAQTEAGARAERARTVQAERKPDPAPQPPPAPTPPSLPTASTSTLPLPPPSAVPVAPPVPPAAAATPAQQPPPADAAATATAAIKDVIDRYKAALENRNLETLKRLWPSLGGAQEAAIRYEFQNATSIDVDIVSPLINVSGTTATATFVRRYQLQTADRQNPRTETRTTMNLHRTGTAWVIDQIRFEAVK